VVPKHFNLAPDSGWILGRLGSEVPRRFGGAELSRELGIRGGEVVVPEERHLLLQRPVAVHHSEQPPLPRVGDARARREGTCAGHAKE
jgi:hypothetical protein